MSVMSLNYIVCMFSVGIWCDDKWQFGHFCLWCAEAAKLILSLRAISSSSVFRVPWLRGPRVRPAPRRPRPPQPSRSCRPSPASSSRWPLTPKQEDEILLLHWIVVKTLGENHSLSPVLVDCPARPGAALVCTWAPWRTPSAWCYRWRGSTGSLACSSRHGSACA